MLLSNYLCTDESSLQQYLLALQIIHIFCDIQWLLAQHQQALHSNSDLTHPNTEQSVAKREGDERERGRGGGGRNEIKILEINIYENASIKVFLLMLWMRLMVTKQLMTLRTVMITLTCNVNSQ